jgi:ParB family transcriptional regulator, chromosome partitioning protein
MSDKKVKKLENFEDLFKLDELPDSGEKTEQHEIEISKLIPFKGHPFKPYEGKKLDDMVESIKENGVITPIVVRPKDGDVFEILSGHNRVNAAKIIGLEMIPGIIREGLSDAEARIIVTDTNFMQRSLADMLPSEIAKSLKMQLEACKEAKQKQELVREIENADNASDINGFEQGAPVGHLQKSRDIIAENNCMSRENIRRYIRLNNLIDDLLEIVDSGQIPLRAAVDLSYIRNDEQIMIFEAVKTQNSKIDMQKAQMLRNHSESGNLTEEKITAILSGEFNKRKRSDKPTVIKLKPKLVSKFFNPEQKQAEIEEVIEKALTLYFEKLKETEAC